MRTDESRFRGKVNAAPGAGCWLWTACFGKTGYGQFSVRRQRVLAHRFSWELVNGPVPDGLCVLHRCDVRGCVNPDHLFLGTVADNAADRDAKGRAHNGDQRGVKNPAAKLTREDAAAIRSATGTQAEIGARFGVSQPQVSNIKRGLSWIAG